MGLPVTAQPCVGALRAISTDVIQNKDINARETHGCPHLRSATDARFVT